MCITRILLILPLFSFVSTEGQFQAIRCVVLLQNFGRYVRHYDTDIQDTFSRCYRFTRAMQNKFFNGDPDLGACDQVTTIDDVGFNCTDVYDCTELIRADRGCLIRHKKHEFLTCTAEFQHSFVPFNNKTKRLCDKLCEQQEKQIDIYDVDLETIDKLQEQGLDIASTTMFCFFQLNKERVLASLQSALDEYSDRDMYTILKINFKNRTQKVIYLILITFLSMCLVGCFMYGLYLYWPNANPVKYSRLI